MDRPYEIDRVDALVASSIRIAMRIEQREPADPPFVAESLAAQLLIRRRDATTRGTDGSVHLIAGFRIAMMLSCRVLADPFRTHSRGVQGDFRRVAIWLEKARGRI